MRATPKWHGGGPGGRGATLVSPSRQARPAAVLLGRDRRRRCDHSPDLRRRHGSQPLSTSTYLSASSSSSTPKSRIGAAEFPVQLTTATSWLSDLEGDVQDKLANVPMLLAWGLHDLMFSRRFMERFRETFNSVHIQRLDAKHYIQEDAPKEIAEAIETFLTSADVSAGSH